MSRANSRTNLHRSRASIGVDSLITLDQLNVGSIHHNKSIANQCAGADLPKGILRRDSAPKTSVTTGFNSKEGSKRVSIERSQIGYKNGCLSQIGGTKSQNAF